MIAIPELDALVRITTEPAAQAIGWALLQFVWQGALIGALTAATLAALRRSAADVRYVVSTIALCLMLTDTRGHGRAGHQCRPGVSDLERAEPSAARVQVVPAAPAQTHLSARAVRPGWQQRTRPVLPPPPERGTFAGSRPGSSPRGLSACCSSPCDWPLDGCGCTICARMQRRPRPARSARWPRASRVACTCRAAFVSSNRRSSKCRRSIGWLKPVILIPTSALAGLSPLQLEAILAHELAHIRRHDYLVNLLQTLVETLLFYHPAVWWVSKQIRIERENCCDDLAVSLCGDPILYAQALADLEHLRGAGTNLVLAANGGSLLHRVKRLLWRAVARRPCAGMARWRRLGRRARDDGGHRCRGDRPRSGITSAPIVETRNGGARPSSRRSDRCEGRRTSAARWAASVARRGSSDS